MKLELSHTHLLCNLVQCTEPSGKRYDGVSAFVEAVLAVLDSIFDVNLSKAFALVGGGKHSQIDAINDSVCIQSSASGSPHKTCLAAAVHLDPTLTGYSLFEDSSNVLMGDWEQLARMHDGGVLEIES